MFRRSFADRVRARRALGGVVIAAAAAQAPLGELHVVEQLPVARGEARGAAARLALGELAEGRQGVEVGGHRAGRRDPPPPHRLEEPPEHFAHARRAGGTRHGEERLGQRTALAAAQAPARTQTLNLVRETLEMRVEHLFVRASMRQRRSGRVGFTSHSGVKLCRWTKAQLRGRGGCYKHSFYGIESHRCMEATPSLACANKCVFCWRHHTNPVGREWQWQMDDAETLVTSAISEHKGMIKQMKGVPGVLPERLAEGMDPRHCALSLVGEPIMYPEIDKFVSLLHAKRISTFLVTNAQFPDAITDLPAITQLYVSVDAATPETLKAIDRPLFGDYWVREPRVGFFFRFRFRRRRQTRTPGASLSSSDCSFDGLSTAARCRHERRLKIPRGDVRSPHGIIGDHTYRKARRPVSLFATRRATRREPLVSARDRRSRLTSHGSSFRVSTRRIASSSRSPRSGTRTSARCTA